jgi:hypothetical protein
MRILEPAPLGSSTGLQGPSWRIGPDGAIYGIPLEGAYKLQSPS